MSSSAHGHRPSQTGDGQCLRISRLKAPQQTVSRPGFEASVKPSLAQSGRPTASSSIAKRRNDSSTTAHSAAVSRTPTGFGASVTRYHACPAATFLPSQHRLPLRGAVPQHIVRPPTRPFPASLPSIHAPTDAAVSHPPSTIRTHPAALTRATAFATIITTSA
jgi:hypothetical protein